MHLYQCSSTSTNAQGIILRAKRQGIKTDNLDVLENKIYSLENIESTDHVDQSAGKIDELLKYYLNGQFSDAETREFDYSKVSRKPDWLESLASILRQTERKCEAVDINKTAIKLFPKNPEHYYNLGNLQNDLVRIKDAVISFKRAIILKPSFNFAYNNLGNAYRLLGRQNNSKVNLCKAKILDPGFALAYRNLGKTCTNSPE